MPHAFTMNILYNIHSFFKLPVIKGSSKKRKRKNVRQEMERNHKINKFFPKAQQLSNDGDV